MGKLTKGIVDIHAMINWKKIPLLYSFFAFSCLICAYSRQIYDLGSCI